MSSLTILAGAALLCSGCGHSAPLAPLPVGGLHVLFVGNSLTYTNDLPATVAAIAASAGDTLRVAMSAGPNLALIDHINGATNALDAIGSGSWDYVVLQQGPTPAGICRDSLVLWTRMFDNRIRNVGATPALFMTWPATNQRAGFDAVRISFHTAAEAVSGVFLACGRGLARGMGSRSGTGSLRSRWLSSVADRYVPGRTDDLRAAQRQRRSNVAAPGVCVRAIPCSA